LRPYIDSQGLYNHKHPEDHINIAIAWMNKHLQKRESEIKDLNRSLSTGVPLINFLEVITGYTLKDYDPKPENIPQCMENLKIAIKLLNVLKVCPSNVTPQDLFHGKIEAVISVLYTVCKKFKDGKKSAAETERDKRIELLQKEKERRQMIKGQGSESEKDEGTTPKQQSTDKQ